MSEMPLQAEQVFGRAGPLVLEIGSGMGGATVEQAVADPATDILAVDVHTPGIGALLVGIESRRLTNVRAVHGDAVEVLDQMIAPSMLSGARIYFPDPWPKTRHHKRRLIQPEFVRLLVTRLQPGGFIHCATDVPDYAQQIVDVLSAHSQLIGGTVPRPAQRPITKFEARAIARGRQIADVWVTRRLNA
jgi:tRNA (guanine-N7-)-methyltransferase